MVGDIKKSPTNAAPLHVVEEFLKTTDFPLSLGALREKRSSCPYEDYLTEWGTFNGFTLLIAGCGSSSDLGITTKNFAEKYNAEIDRIASAKGKTLEYLKIVKSQTSGKANGYFELADKSYQINWGKATADAKNINCVDFFFGTSRAATERNSIIGRGKWADKVGAGAVGALLFAPLAITSAIGAYKQNKLPAEIFECIEKFIISGGVSVHRNVSFDRLNSSQMKCPNCGATMSGNKICSRCGAELSPNQKFCGKCSTPAA